MSQISKENEFALFIDESGSPKPNPKDIAPFFAMGGVLVKRQDEHIIEEKVANFKHRWNPYIRPDTPLHGNEIRSKKKKFAWLGTVSDEQREKFMSNLTETIISCPIVVHACVVSRNGYINRYFERYGENTWEMMKSAFSILIERTAKYAANQNGTIMVYFENAGKTEDNLIKTYFNELRSTGHPFNPLTSNKYSPLSSNELSTILRGIEGKPKSNSIIQIADLCLYPVSKSKSYPSDRAFKSLKDNNLLVDCHLAPSLIETIGIKYYCFDD